MQNCSQAHFWQWQRIWNAWSEVRTELKDCWSCASDRVLSQHCFCPSKYWILQGMASAGLYLCKEEMIGIVTWHSRIQSLLRWRCSKWVLAKPECLCDPAKRIPPSISKTWHPEAQDLNLGVIAPSYTCAQQNLEILMMAGKQSSLPFQLCRKREQADPLLPLLWPPADRSFVISLSLKKRLGRLRPWFSKL